MLNFESRQRGVNFAFPKFLNLPVAEPNSDDFFFELQGICDGRNFGRCGFWLFCELLLQLIFDVEVDRSPFLSLTSLNQNMRF